MLHPLQAFLADELSSERAGAVAPTMATIGLCAGGSAQLRPGERLALLYHTADALAAYFREWMLTPGRYHCANYKKMRGSIVRHSDVSAPFSVLLRVGLGNTSTRSSGGTLPPPAPRSPAPNSRRDLEDV